MGIGERQKMNSLSLRNAFPSRYEDLFSSCQVAFSASDSFFWAGEYARFYGGLTILQKLPTKNIVGLEIINEKKICFNDNLYGYNPSKNTFENIVYDGAKEIRLLNFLDNYWPTLDPEGKIKGFKIHILSESHCGGGLGTTGVHMACLAACLLTLAGQVKVSEIDVKNKVSTHELINSEKYESFRKIFRLAWRLTAICRDGNSSGASSFAALISSPYPIIYFSKNVNKYLSQPNFCAAKDKAEQCKMIDDIPFWGSRIDEVFPIKVPQPWPIDIGRIYSGTLINTENIFKSLSTLETNIQALRDSVYYDLEEKIQNDKLSLDYLFKFDAESGRTCCYQDFLDIFNLLSSKLLLAIRDLFLLGPQEDNLRNFFSAIHQTQDYSHFLGHSTNLLDNICKRITHIAAQENEMHLAAAKIEGIGKGGHVLFMMPSGVMFEKVLQETQEIGDKTSKNISLDWASWIDGFGEDGLKVEQFLPENIYSPFISQQNYHLTSICQNNSTTKIIDLDKIGDIVSDYDLALVAPEHKVYVKGKALSSKQIPSAKSTIDIMRKILNSKNLQIDNKQFNSSSYGQSRYDLQSKIFIPLAKAIEKNTKKKLEVHITGGMYDNFSVKLNLKDLKIAVIESVG
ncbi:MAG: hypothetical protein Q7S37_02080 [bacterium]|nr:hypothetical protein [bacterium]